MLFLLSFRRSAGTGLGLVTAGPLFGAGYRTGRRRIAGAEAPDAGSLRPEPASHGRQSEAAPALPHMHVMSGRRRRHHDERHRLTISKSVRRRPRLNRYVAVIALRALGQDEVVADAVWELAPEVTRRDGRVRHAQTKGRPD